MKNNHTPGSNPDAGTGSSTGYIIGFGLSLFFTIGAYLLVQLHLDTFHRIPPDTILLIILAGLALIQLFVQLVFFLHLGRESKPRWNLMVLLFAALIVFIVVGGSLWIMTSLNYHMTPSNVMQYMNSQDGF